MDLVSVQHAVANEDASDADARMFLTCPSDFVARISSTEVCKVFVQFDDPLIEIQVRKILEAHARGMLSTAETSFLRRIFNIEDQG